MKKIKFWRIEPPIPLKHESGYLGFDPGTVNMGIAISLKGSIVLAQVLFEREKDPVWRMTTVQTCVKAVINHILFSYPFLPKHAVIEGAGFEASQYRQVEMAENRISIAQSLVDMGMMDCIKFAAPNSIRKTVLGGGRIKAHEVWDNEDIPNDALAALSCLYYADMMEDE